MTVPLPQDLSSFDLLLLVFAAILMPVLSTIAGRRLAREKPEERRLIPRYWRIIARGVIVVALVLGVWHVLGRPYSELGLGRLNIWDYAGFAAIVMSFVFLGFQLVRLKSLSPERLEKAMKSINSIKITPTTRGELSVFMLMSMSAGVWEELLYRGFLIWFLTPSAGVIGAIVISSMIFGLGHIYQGASGVAKTGAIGLVFATLYVLSGSLWWLMAAHALIDIYGGFVTFRIKQLAAQQAHV